MNINELLRQHNYHLHNDFKAIIAQAVALHQQGKGQAEILNSVRATYGEVTRQTMRTNAAPLAQFGVVGVDFDPATISQMYDALKMPVAVQGALMPDGHKGYGLPIGGVIALDNAVWPGGVGYDIACRVSITIFHPDQLSPADVRKNRGQFLADMQAVSHFGPDNPPWRRDHRVLEHPLWKTDPILRGLLPKAAAQLGTSGAGNHFVDLMIGRSKSDLLAIGDGQEFVALVTHSGSRGVGHAFAEHYIKVAEQETAKRAVGVPKGYGWLGLDTEAGQAYWAGMELMGEYAQANHHLIHQEFVKRIGLDRAYLFFENHHNFAWREDGLVVHRKGATPARLGQYGIIPGSVADYAYLVQGRGNRASLFSASHGAGRNFSRTEAIKQFDASASNKRMAEWGVLAHGVAQDESFHAYKPMSQVMPNQEGILVDVKAVLQPAVVLMGGFTKSDDGD